MNSGSGGCAHFSFLNKIEGHNQSNCDNQQGSTHYQSKAIKHHIVETNKDDKAGKSLDLSEATHKILFSKRTKEVNCYNGYCGNDALRPPGTIDELGINEKNWYVPVWLI